MSADWTQKKNCRKRQNHLRRPNYEVAKGELIWSKNTGKERNNDSEKESGEPKQNKEVKRKLLDIIYLESLEKKKQIMNRSNIF